MRLDSLGVMQKESCLPETYGARTRSTITGPVSPELSHRNCMRRLVKDEDMADEVVGWLLSGWKLANVYLSTNVDRVTALQRSQHHRMK